MASSSIATATTRSSGDSKNTSRVVGGDDDNDNMMAPPVNDIDWDSDWTPGIRHQPSIYQTEPVTAPTTGTATAIDGYQRVSWTIARNYSDAHNDDNDHNHGNGNGNEEQDNETETDVDEASLADRVRRHDHDASTRVVATTDAPAIVQWSPMEYRAKLFASERVMTPLIRSCIYVPLVTLHVPLLHRDVTHIIASYLGTYCIRLLLHIYVLHCHYWVVDILPRAL